jgi:hypothetical protein
MDINIKVRVQGAGEIVFDHKLYKVNRNSWIFTKILQLGSYSYYNQPYFKLYSLHDFINMSIPVGAISPAGLIS